MNFADALGHSYNIIYLIAFTLRDIIWMRFLMIAAAGIEIGYCFLGTSNPWTGVPWAILAIAANGYHFTKLLIDKGTINFNSEERAMHLSVFPTMSLLQFKHLLAVGRWHTFGERAEIIQEGGECKDLILIVSGTASVEVNSVPIATLTKNNFAGEMSFLTSQPTTARVMSQDTVRCLLWNGGDLRLLLQKEPDLDNALQAVFNKLLVRKLAETNLVAATRAPCYSGPVVAPHRSLFARMIAATPAMFKRFRRKGQGEAITPAKEDGKKSV